MAGKRGAQDKHSDRCARPFAKAHAEIEQRVEVKLFEKQAVTRFGGLMSRYRMIERIFAELRQGRHGGRADKTIEQNGNAQMPRGKSSAENGGKLAPA